MAYLKGAYAEVAQLVEHLLAMQKVAGSNPVFRSSWEVAGSNPVFCIVSLPKGFMRK